MARRKSGTNLPAPFLRSIRMRPSETPLPDRYPYTLPWLDADFELDFETPVTILMGENGTGKSTLLEAIATLAGFSTSGGGKWVGGAPSADADDAEALAACMQAGWLPKVGNGWFLKAQSFAAVSAATATDYLAFSHGEGFSELVQDRMQGQGVFLLDEPEAALSPKRQAELLRFISEIQSDASAQIIMATHSPILMAVPNATLLRLSHRGIEQCSFRDTDHFKFYQSFVLDPDGFVAAALTGDWDRLI